MNDEDVPFTRRFYGILVLKSCESLANAHTKKHHSTTNNLFKYLPGGSFSSSHQFHLLCLPLLGSLGRLNGWFAFNIMKWKYSTYQSRLPIPPHSLRIGVYYVSLSLSSLYSLSLSDRLLFGTVNNNLFDSVFQSIFAFVSVWSPGKKEGSKTLFAGSFVLKDRKNHFKWLAVFNMVWLWYGMAWPGWIEFIQWNEMKQLGCFYNLNCRSLSFSLCLWHDLLIWFFFYLFDFFRDEGVLRFPYDFF